MRKVASAVVIAAAAAANAYAKPCPQAEVEKQLPKLYEDTPNKGVKAKITACVEGKFAGPGWMLYYTTPAGDKVVRPDEGGVVFVKADGTIGASSFGRGARTVDAHAADLDGDGVDEIVATLSVTTEMGDVQILLVSRVKNGKIEDLLSKDYAAGGGGLTCTTKTSVEPRNKTKVVVVTAKQSGKVDSAGPWPQECAFTPGKHVFVMKNGKVDEAAN